MLGPNTTWGDLRKIRAKFSTSLDSTPDDLLADPDILKMSIGKPDDELVWPKDEFGTEPDGDDPIEFYVTTDDKDIETKALIRLDMEEGTMEYRRDGEWIHLQKGEEIPEIDDYEMLQVTGETTSLWDKAEEEGQTLMVKDLGETLLDEV